MKRAFIREGYVSCVVRHDGLFRVWSSQVGTILASAVHAPMVQARGTPEVPCSLQRPGFRRTKQCIYNVHMR